MIIVSTKTIILVTQSGSRKMQFDWVYSQHMIFSQKKCEICYHMWKPAPISSNTVKPVLSSHSRRKPKLVFKTDFR